MVKALRSFVTTAVVAGLLGLVPLIGSGRAGAAAFSWKNCGPADAPLTVTNLKVTPDPLVAGQGATIVDAWGTRTDITSGAYQVLMITREPNGHTFEVPEPFVWLPGTPSFPIKAGTYGTPVSGVPVAIPGFLPAGVFDLQITAYDSSNAELGCLELTVQIVHAPHNHP